MQLTQKSLIKALPNVVFSITDRWHLAKVGRLMGINQEKTSDLIPVARWEARKRLQLETPVRILVQARIIS